MDSEKESPMTTRDEFRFQPGWATPIVVDYRNPGFISWLLRLATDKPVCLAKRQDRCPGPDQCHDCAWSPQENG